MHKSQGKRRGNSAIWHMAVLCLAMASKPSANFAARHVHDLQGAQEVPSFAAAAATAHLPNTCTSMACPSSCIIIDFHTSSCRRTTRQNINHSADQPSQMPAGTRPQVHTRKIAPTCRLARRGATTIVDTFSRFDRAVLLQ